MTVGNGGGKSGYGWLVCVCGGPCASHGCSDVGLCLHTHNHTPHATQAGYGRVVVDPLVRLAYDARTDLDLHARHDL